jgi:nucleotide-binding universal stress UspA family protein
MAPISRILVPVDFSDRCLGILPSVAAIARRYHSDVTLLHVVNRFYAIPGSGISEPMLLPVPEWVVAERKKQLDNFAAGSMEGIAVERLVYEGDPELQIAACAADVQLVVMPTHGYGVIRRFLLGSVTAKVLHDVTCPVLTSAHLDDVLPDTEVTFSNIVCALDLNPQSRDTLAWAADFARDFNAKLTAIHIVPPVNPGLYVSFSSKVKEELEQMARDDVQKLLDEVGAAASICIREGDIVREVCRFARSVGADLLVIGRGAQAAAGGRLRTNAYGIIRGASCPVLSV